MISTPGSVRRSWVRVLGLLLVASEAGAIGLERDVGDESLLFCFGPPTLQAHPDDPDVGFLACLSFPPLVGVAAVTLDPALALGPDPTFPVFSLPADLNGSLADPAQEAVIDDVWIEGDHAGWITTSGHETVIPFDPLAGRARPVLFEGVARLSVPTARTIRGEFTDSRGVARTVFTTSFTSGVLRVGDRLLVSTSNLTPNPLAHMPGTVLLFDIVDPAASPLRIAPAQPPFVVTSDFNPTALTPLPGGLVAVTNTGPIEFSLPPDSLPGPTGPGSIDILDPLAGTLLASIPLGLASPSFRMLALDPSGSVAVLGSATFRQLYAVDLRGLGELAVPELDPTRQRPSCNDGSAGVAAGLPCLRTRVVRGVAQPIPLPPAPGLGGVDGFIGAVRFGASGRFVVATAFNDGLVVVVPFDPRNLETPHPLLASRFGPAESLVVTPPLDTFGVEVGPGPMILRASADGRLDGTDVIWLTLGPDGSVMRGTLRGQIVTPSGDADADAVEDALDSCPFLPNPGSLQIDSGGVAEDASVPDGIGDGCQCGDVDGDGRVLPDDLDVLRRYLAGTIPALPEASLCNVAGEPGLGRCDLLDRVVLERRLSGHGPGLAQICPPALPAATG